jgi:hypothetical protein
LMECFWLSDVLKHECSRAANAGGECGEATNAQRANVLRTNACG